MTKKHIGAPGVGGSLGCCAVCGDPFIHELVYDMFGIDIIDDDGNPCSGIKSFSLGIDPDQVMYVHETRCVAMLKKAGVHEHDIDAFCNELPERSPLRRALIRLRDDMQQQPEKANAS